MLHQKAGKRTVNFLLAYLDRSMDGGREGGQPDIAAWWLTDQTSISHRKFLVVQTTTDSGPEACHLDSCLRSCPRPRPRGSDLILLSYFVVKTPFPENLLGLIPTCHAFFASSSMDSQISAFVDPSECAIDSPRRIMSICATMFH